MSVGDEVDAGSRPTRRPDDDPTRPQAMPWAQYVDSVLSKWHQMLSDDPEESEVQAFLPPPCDGARRQRGHRSGRPPRLRPVSCLRAARRSRGAVEHWFRTSCG